MLVFAMLAVDDVETYITMNGELVLVMVEYICTGITTLSEQIIHSFRCIL